MFTNSSLISGTLLTKNCSKRKYDKIDTITIHCFVGQVTGKRGCEIFIPASKKASANYIVGKDGDIWLNVEEKNRAWTTGGKYTVNGETGSNNDHHAVTIEVACDPKHPYKVTAKAYEALIRLVADIAKRNGMGELKWKADKNLVGHPDKQNMTVHRWFAPKACPGDYLYERMGDIAMKANKINHTDDSVAGWASDGWNYCKTVGLMDGTRPTANITRQEMATILWRLHNKGVI